MKMELKKKKQLFYWPIIIVINIFKRQHYCFFAAQVASVKNQTISLNIYILCMLVDFTGKFLVVLCYDFLSQQSQNNLNPLIKSSSLCILINSRSKEKFYILREYSNNNKIIYGDAKH